MSNVTSLLKSILHNVGVVAVGLGIAFLGTKIDLLLGIRGFHSAVAAALGWLLIAVGFLIRVWATFYFYMNRMKVISSFQQRSSRRGRTASRATRSISAATFIFFGAALRGIADRAGFHCDPSPIDGPVHSARGETTGADVWRGVGALQTSSTQMDLTHTLSLKCRRATGGAMLAT